MRKVFVAFCSLALFLGAVSCQKDGEMITPLKSTPEPLADTTYVEGVFNPAHHIASCTELGAYYEYVWSDSQPRQLLEINDPVMGSHTTLAYKGNGRLANVKGKVGGREEMLNFSYDDGTLVQVTYRAENLIKYVSNVSYAGNHISHIMYEDVTSDMMIGLANSLSDYNFGMTYPRMNDPHFTVNYTWEGENVVKTDVEGIVTGTITLSQMFELFEESILANLGLPQNFGNIVPLLVMLVGDSSYVYNVAFERATNFTYDTKANPYHGFYGRGLLLGTECMSANNVLTATAVGNAKIAIDYSIHLPENPPSWVPSSFQDETLWFLLRTLISDQPFHLARTLDLSDVQENTYEYNRMGFPTKVNCADGSTIIYTYLD